MDKRLGAQLYTVRNLMKTPEDFCNTMKEISKIGYKTVQLSGIDNSIITLDVVKKGVEEANLEVICAQNFKPNEFPLDIDMIIDYYKTLNCSIAGVGGGNNEMRDSMDGLKAYIKQYNAIARKLKDNGITFTYHNHAFEFYKLDGKYIMDYLIEETDPDAFGFVLDAYWLSFAGIDPVKYIEKLGKRCKIIHLKDMMVLPAQNKVEMCEVMEGNLDFDKIINACEENGVVAAMVEQDTCVNGKPLESLKISYNNLVKKGYC